MHEHLHSDHISLSASKNVLGFESQSWPTIRSPVGFFNTVDLGDLSQAKGKPEDLDVVSQASHVMSMCSQSWTYGCISCRFNPRAVRTPVQYNLCFSMGLPRTGRRPVQLWQPPGWTHLLPPPPYWPQRRIRFNSSTFCTSVTCSFYLSNRSTRTHLLTPDHHQELPSSSLV